MIVRTVTRRRLRKTYPKPFVVEVRSLINRRWHLRAAFQTLAGARRCEQFILDQRREDREDAESVTFVPYRLRNRDTDVVLPRQT